jgi:REP element-mobilizing transposase RayT
LIVGQPVAAATCSSAFRLGKRSACPTIPEMGHPPRIPVWLRWDQSVIYFVTLCVENREPVLANDETFIAFKNAAMRLRDWTVLAAVLMPDHLHVLVSPTKDREAKLGNFSAAIKRWTRQELRASWNWQPGSFDRLLRSDESLQDKWLYVEENPVRAGLVKHYLDWPYRYAFNEL